MSRKCKSIKREVYQPELPETDNMMTRTIYIASQEKLSLYDRPQALRYRLFRRLGVRSHVDSPLATSTSTLCPKLPYIFFSCIMLVLTSAACSKPNSNSPSAATSTPSWQRITSQGVVKAAAKPAEIPAGGSAEAIVRLTIQNGYHVNANPPTYPYLIATALELSPSDGVWVSYVIYPQAVNRTFAFAEQALAVYEGETDLKVFLEADKTAKKGERSIPAKLRIQACDEQVCYPPGAIELTIPLNVK
jgi:DsbC/DsbD-like thiol-disulfide interchange protein